MAGEDISLHPSAKEMFRTSNDTNPTITSVESFHARLWFDLISQQMIASKGQHNVRHLLPLRAASNADFDADFAREAFNANFRDYLRKFRGINNANEWGLYAILDVQSARYSYAQIIGREFLTLKPSPKLGTFLLPINADVPSRLRKLTDAMAQEVRALDTPDASLAARSDYMRILGSNSVERSMGSDGFLDLGQWLQFETRETQSHSAAFIGYPYIERNRRELGALLVQLESERLNPKDDWVLHWLRPGGSSWGATEDLSDLIGDFRGVVRRFSQGACGLTANLIVPTSVANKNARTFDRLFDRGLKAVPGRLAIGVEVLVIPDVIAVVSVVVALSPTIRVPIGRMTVDKQLIQDVIERSQILRLESDSTLLWKQRRARAQIENATQI
jgi:hypothetical protein